MTWIPETGEVAAPSKPKRFGERAELIPPPARDFIATEAQDVDVERLPGQVFGSERLRAPRLNQFALCGSGS